MTNLLRRLSALKFDTPGTTKGMDCKEMTISHAFKPSMPDEKSISGSQSFQDLTSGLSGYHQKVENEILGGVL